MVVESIVITPAEFTAKIPSPLPAVIITVSGVASVIETVITVSPTAASSATEPVWPFGMIMSTESITVTV